VIHPRSRLALLTAVLVGAVAATFGAAPAQAAADVGYVRLAHLSPDTGKVDVYLSKVGDPAFGEQVFRHVGYGVMSKYLALPVGTYAVAMRGENAPASSPPVLTTQVTVSAGGAYTVAGTGKHAVLGLTVLQDDLSRPVAGKAKVRVIQASVASPVLNVSFANGTPIASNVNFASTTPYELVNPGSWTLKLQAPNGSNPSTLGCTIGGGSVYSLLVLDSPTGLKLEMRTDARGGADAPDGGVETGAGGAESWPAPEIPSSGNSLVMIAVGAAVLVALVLVAVRLRRVASRRA
jgi:hypothetical protein